MKLPNTIFSKTPPVQAGRTSLISPDTSKRRFTDAFERPYIDTNLLDSRMTWPLRVLNICTSGLSAWASSRSVYAFAHHWIVNSKGIELAQSFYDSATNVESGLMLKEGMTSGEQAVVIGCSALVGYLTIRVSLNILNVLQTAYFRSVVYKERHALLKTFE